MFTFLYGGSDLVIFLLRVFLGAVFIVHGWPKIKDLKQTAQNFEGMGFKPGTFWGPFVAILEFFGGLALLLGFLTQIFALLFAVEFVVITLWKIKSGQKFAGGYEFDLSLLVMSLILLVSGSGLASLDGYINLPFSL